MMEQEYLTAARTARARLEAARAEVKQATGEFEDAIRHLHLHGASVREIAEAFDVSHQRAHQLAGARLKTWRAGAPGHRSCSFCGDGEHTDAPLIAGPAVFICRSCVAVARQAAAVDTAHGNGHVEFAPVDDAKVRCAFCRRRQRRHGTMVRAGSEHICGRCLRFCDEVAAGHTAPAA